MATRLSYAMLAASLLLLPLLVCSENFHLYRKTYSDSVCNRWIHTAGVEANVCITEMDLLPQLLNQRVQPSLFCPDCKAFSVNVTSLDTCEEGVFSVFKDVDCTQPLASHPWQGRDFEVTGTCESNNIGSSSSKLLCTDNYYSIRPGKVPHYTHFLFRDPTLNECMGAPTSYTFALADGGCISVDGTSSFEMMCDQYDGSTYVNTFEGSANCSSEMIFEERNRTCEAVDFDRNYSSPSAALLPSYQPTGFPTQIQSDDDYFVHNFRHDAFERIECVRLVSVFLFPTQEPTPSLPTMSPTSPFPTVSPTKFAFNVFHFTATLTFSNLLEAVHLNDPFLLESFALVTCQSMNLTAKSCDCGDDCLSLFNRTSKSFFRVLDAGSSIDLVAKVRVNINLVDYPNFRDSKETILYNELRAKLNNSVVSGVWLDSFQTTISNFEDYSILSVLQAFTLSNMQLQLSTVNYHVAITSSPTSSPTPTAEESRVLPASVVIGITVGVAGIIILFFFTSHYCTYGCSKKDVEIHPEASGQVANL